MNTNDDFFTRGISFPSFIAINRYMDKQILNDSKLLTLMIYIALRVKRSGKTESNNWSGINLNIGEFIIGRLTTVKETDLTETEYRSRIKKLQTLKIIDNLQPTNKYTKGNWLENSFIDINLEQSAIQQDNQQKSSELTTNNNINNANNPIFSIVNSLNKNNTFNTYNTNDYVTVITSYMQHKGIELKGNEIKNTFFVVKKIFESERTTQQIIQFMQWLKKHEGYEEYPWINSWTINTVQRKLPEFLANKLKIRTWEDDYPSL